MLFNTLWKGWDVITAKKAIYSRNKKPPNFGGACHGAAEGTTCEWSPPLGQAGMAPGWAGAPSAPGCPVDGSWMGSFSFRFPLAPSPPLPPGRPDTGLPAKGADGGRCASACVSGRLGRDDPAICIRVRKLICCSCKKIKIKDTSENIMGKNMKNQQRLAAFSTSHTCLPPRLRDPGTPSGKRSWEAVSKKEKLGFLSSRSCPWERPCSSLRESPSDPRGGSNGQEVITENSKMGVCRGLLTRAPPCRAGQQPLNRDEQMTPAQLHCEREG